VYPKIDPGLHHALRNFLNYALAVHLNARLPDTLDHILIGDLRSYCYQAWQAQKRA
jgi:hypothetical protein